MRFFLGVAVVLFAVLPTLLTLQMEFRRRIAAVLLGCSAAAVLAHLAGADMSQAFSRSTDLVLILGYTAVAAVAAQNGTVSRLSRRVGTHPVAVMFLSMAVAVLTSNDTAVVALAPIAILSRTPWRTGAALFIGSNVVALALPQGSPTNVLIKSAAAWDFVSYAKGVLPEATALLLVATLFMLVISRSKAESSEKEQLHPAEPVGSDYRVLSAVLACVLLQPVFDAFELPQWLLGVLLIVLSLLAARWLRVSPAEVLKQTAWLVLPMGVVLCAAGGLIATSVGSNSVWLLCLTLFALSATITDIAAAGVAASLVAQGLVPASAALVAVTAGAFATPFGSLSGLLLLQRFAASGVKPDKKIFVAASVCACFAWVAGTLVALR
jgi:Na+/H+ antiporter NhaD/arsenite permease-like protein